MVQSTIAEFGVLIIWRLGSRRAHDEAMRNGMALGLFVLDCVSTYGIHCRSLR